MFLILGQGMLFAQFTTPVIDGTINAGEYGTHAEGANQITSSATTWYMCWDANNLYLATNGSNITEGAVVYLDFDPVLPVNGGVNANGSTQGLYYYDRNFMMMPFRADFVVYFKNSYHEYRTDDGAGYWGGATSNTLTLAAGFASVEIAIPWNVITGGGRPASFNWFGYKTYDYGPGTNGLYDPAPVGNPSCACNQDPSVTWATRYFNVLSTANGSSTLPFSTQSFTYAQDYSVPGTGGYFLAGGIFYDFTINDNSTNNADNDPVNHVYDNNGPANRVLHEGNLTISHDLYVGQGSAFLPANNVGPDVLSTVTFSGTNGSIRNYGRIDPNPEASSAGDWNHRRMDFVFNGITTIQPTNLFKDRFRFSNVTVNPGAELHGPGSDSAQIELQWGIINNNGLINFGDGSGGILNLGTRGDWSQHNDVFLNSSSNSGVWILHDMLIGRNSSRLQPVAGGGIATLQVKGDFENYDEFSGENAGGRIDVRMNGFKKQYFRGNTTETTGATTSFFNLEIANDNGSANNNAGADVHFLSFGGGTINYNIFGTLTLTKGDLVTRTGASIHKVTLKSGAGTSYLGATSNAGGNPSCYVDGPLTWEVATASPVDLAFPIGKTDVVLGNPYADYRHLNLTIDQNAATPTEYTAEMFIVDRSGTYTFPSPIPEPIINLSNRRYWNVTKSAGAALDSAKINLSYETGTYDDFVLSPSILRICKDDGAGNWVNICPFGPGGTAAGNGNITSHAFFSFSDFILSNIDNSAFPVELLDFEARWAGKNVLLEWATASELNAAKFVVEKSSDLDEFMPVGEKTAAGNSNQVRFYNLLDENVHTEIPVRYYRLKIVDQDGSFHYSGIRALYSDQQNNLHALIFPNPNAGSFQIKVNGFSLEKEIEIRVFDALGKLVWERRLPAEAGFEAMRVELPVESGVYEVQVRSGHAVWNGKVVVSD
ncbi:MAG: T9SS type A sorting domain-containing protein [Bacteroidia bacterium]|nr:T9SS type A sorting domain-containing protein [Bacteroidia bacterium]